MDREDYLRVTEVISPFSGIEFVPQHYLQPAAERGTIVHNWIEQRLSGFLIFTETKMAIYLESFDFFWEE